MTLVHESRTVASPAAHYADTFDDWRAGKYHVVSLRRDDVERDAEGTTVLISSA